MRNTKSAGGFLLWVALVLVQSITGSASASSAKPPAASVATPQASSDVAGTWSGMFQSARSQTSPFTMTIVIAPESNGQLMGKASLASDCFGDGDLHVIVTGETVVFAGHDAEGNNITLRGGLDDSRTILKMHYVVNGSASARCESDEGDGSLGKR